MRKKLARALCKLDSRIVGDKGGCDCTDCTKFSTYFPQVDVLLAALMEPDAEIGMAGYAAWDKFGEDAIMGPHELVAIWQAMLKQAGRG